MGRTQRIAFAAIAAVVAIVAVIVLGGGSDEQTERADAPPAAATSDATPAPQEANPAPSPSATATPEPTPTAEPIETVRFRDGEVVGGPARLEFDKGETVRFAVASDVAEEIHVHGYDRYVDIPAGESKRISFPADIEGIFEVELHGAGIEVARLRVDP